MTYFDSIHIKNFRGIHQCSIDGFKQINVFFGKNNCGKSSLLEALFLISGQANPVLPVVTNSLRGYSRLERNDLRVAFYNTIVKNPIHIEVSGSKARHMDISVYEKSTGTVDIADTANQNSSTSERFYGYKIDFDGEKSSTLLLEDGEDKNNGKIDISKGYNEDLVAVLQSPRSSILTNFVDGFKRMMENKQDNLVLTVLQTIEPKLKQITIVGDSVMVDLGMENLLPIQMMGDGILKILSILTNIYLCRNGILLIDEIDNGLHYSIMPQLWQTLIPMAVACKTQLFVTTHNIDSLKSLSKSGAQNERLTTAFKLIHTDDDNLMGLAYDMDTLQYMLNSETEVR